jgi:hypothetical protein
MLITRAGERRATRQQFQPAGAFSASVVDDFHGRNQLPLSRLALLLRQIGEQFVYRCAPGSQY